MSGDENGSSRNFSRLNQLDDHSGRASRRDLADHAFADSARLEGVIEAETADVRVGANTLDARHVFDVLMNFHLTLETARSRERERKKDRERERERKKERATEREIEREKIKKEAKKKNGKERKRLKERKREKKI